MRFWVRSLLIVVASVGWFFVGPVALRALAVPADAAEFISLAMVVLGGNGLLYAFLRCPRCGKWACLTPGRRRAMVWPGLQCRYCGQPY